MPAFSFNVPRGMKDIGPDEMAKRLWAYGRIAEVLRRYGFQMVEPTTVESLRTLEAKSGPQIRDEIYWFKDKAGRALGLRFDLTVGMTRMVASRYDLPEPIKLCAIGGQWRYDEPQFGRYRYFTAWDAEIYGSPEPVADAEAISVGIDVLNAVGLREFVVRVSNRRLIQSFLASLGIKMPAKVEAVLRVVDKLRKVSRQQMLREFRKLRLRQALIDSILEFTSLRGKPDLILSKISDLAEKGDEAKRAYAELAQLADALDSFEKRDKCIYDLSIVRGIGYYDGIVFEAYDKVGEDVGSIFAGGRYDKLCSIYGRDLPATGVAGGIERLLISLERAQAMPRLLQAPKVFVASVTEATRREAMRIAQKLRGAGIEVDLDLKGRSLAKQLDYANSLKIGYVAIIGPREVEAGQLKLRNMTSGDEMSLSIDDAIRMLSTPAQKESF